MRLKIFLPLLFLMIISNLVSAQNISLAITGECHNFNVTLSETGLEEGCYDVKIEALSPGGSSEIFDPREGWKSSFYYIDKGYCLGRETYRIRTNSNEDLNIKVKLRKDSKTWSSDYYRLKQNCPQEQERPEYFFLIVLLSILIILIGITAYVKLFK